jgi:hypothetical protein
MRRLSRVSQTLRHNIRFVFAAAAPEAKAIWLNEESPLKQAEIRHDVSASFTRLPWFSRRASAHGDQAVCTSY